MTLTIDGSSQNKKIVPGYHVLEMTVPCKHSGQPIVIWSQIYSEREEGFKSANLILENALKKVIEAYGKNVTFVMDRGYDDVKLFQLLDKLEVSYIIRLKSNRKYLCNKKKRNFRQLAETSKGKMKISFKNGSGESYDLKASHKSVDLLNYKCKNLKIVIVHGFNPEKPLVLLTNKKIQSKENLSEIFWAYIKRWKIEQSFRYNKQLLGYEKIQLLKIKSAQNIINILHMTNTALIKEIGNKESSLIKCIIKYGKPLRDDISFIMYQLNKGIKQILKNSQSTFRKYLNLPKKRNGKIINLFNFDLL